MLLAAAVLVVLMPFVRADPPAGLTGSNAPFTDEGFNLANARARVLFGQFATGDIDRSLSNGAYSALAAGVFAVTGPRLAVGRALSMVALAGAVLLLAVGLARPLGTRAALLAAAGLAGSDLALEYGRLALVEPLLVLLLAAALVLAARVMERPGVVAAAGIGLLCAAAVSVKAIALVPVLALLGTVVGGALARRGRHPSTTDRRALAMGLVACGSAVAAGVGWLVVVALPNLERLRTALRIWPRVHYPASPWGVAARLGHYLTHSDQALARSWPLLLAAVVGLAALVGRWRSLSPAARGSLLAAALGGFGLWLAVAVGDYAPNRYVVPALPGLAVVAGFGLDTLVTIVGGWLAGRGRTRTRLEGGRLLAGAPSVVIGVALSAALALLVAVPGAATYLGGAVGSGHQRERDQRLLAARLPAGVTVYGTYGPTLLFDTKLRVLTPWVPADANVDDPVGRFGVTDVLLGGRSDPTGAVADFRGQGAMTLLARVRWNGEQLSLYQVQDP